MIDRLGLRARLTILVTAVFAAALSITAVVALNVVEDAWWTTPGPAPRPFSAATSQSIYGGVATVGVVSRDDATRFFYLDGDGQRDL